MNQRTFMPRTGLVALLITTLFATLALLPNGTPAQAAGPVYVAPSNLLTNSEFENGTNGWYTFGEAPGSAVGAAKHGGDSGLQLGSGQQGLGQNVTLQPNAIYAFSAWGRTTGSEYTQVTLRVVDGAGTATDYQMAFSANEWLRHARTIQTPPTVASAVVYTLKNAGDGIAWIDDISLALGRDAHAWPFDKDSIWNTPLGANAQYTTVPFFNEPSFILDEADSPFGDNTMPRRQAFTAGSVGGANDFGLCNQDPSLGSVGTPQGTLQVPDSYIRNNWTRNPNFTPNNMTGIVQGDGRTIAQIQPTARCVPAGPIFGYRATDADLYGKGISGAHFGSGLSSIGGAIRMGELTGYGPLRHALQIDINMAKNASGTTPFRWPADRADWYTFNLPEGYCSQDPCKSNPAAFAAVGQGSLLALPPGATPESLGIRTEVGRKIFYALQNYGAYIVDDTGWVFEALGAEYGVKDEVQQQYGVSLVAGASDTGPTGDWFHDWSTMFGAIQVVTNNGPTNIGGGGTPRVGPAPAFVGPIPAAPIELSQAGWNVVSATQDSADRANIIDGDPATVWRTGIEQAAGQGFVVDLGSAQTFNRVELDGTATPAEYPQGYSVYTSNDGTTWGAPVHQGTGSGSDVTLATIPVQTVRYLKIELYGGHIAHVPWTVGELRLALVEALVGTSALDPTATPTALPAEDCTINYLNNPGFEVGLDGWFAINGAAALSTDAHTGAGALQSGPAEGGAGQNVAVTPGQTVTLNFWGKRTNPAAYNSIGINFVDGSFASVGSNLVTTVQSDTYQRYTLSGVVPVGAAYATIYTYKTTDTGTLLIDDTTFERCRTAPATATATSIPTATSAPTPTPTTAPTATPLSGAVRPVLECVAKQGNTYTAYFGYSNDNKAVVTIPVGATNKFTPLPQDRGQPTSFLPGRQQRVFSVVFNGDTLVWTLQGRTSTAGRNSQRCH